MPSFRESPKSKLAALEQRRRKKATGNEFRDERNRIKNEEASAFKQLNAQAIHDTLRECAYFYGQAAAIREKMEASGVEFPLSTQARDKLDREMWEHNLKGRCAVELMSQGRLNGTTLELIQSCPKEIRQRIGICLSPQNQQALTEWFMEFESPAPAPKQIEIAEVRRLLQCSASYDSPRLS